LRWGHAVQPRSYSRRRWQPLDPLAAITVLLLTDSPHTRIKDQGSRLHRSCANQIFIKEHLPICRRIESALETNLHLRRFQVPSGSNRQPQLPPHDTTAAVLGFSQRTLPHRTAAAPHDAALAGHPPPDQHIVQPRVVLAADRHNPCRWALSRCVVRPHGRHLRGQPWRPRLGSRCWRCAFRGWGSGDWWRGQTGGWCWCW
jgi:hypothetical protein